MKYTLAQLNQATQDAALAMLDGLYEHSPWIAQAALAQRPFASLADLQYKMVQVLEAGGEAKKRALICAHPELAGKAMQSNGLTAESALEQSKAGLTQCSAAELAQIQALNQAYRAKHGFPFVLAVRGPRGLGLSKAQILATFARRLQHSSAFELEECIRNIHRIVEIRLHDKFGLVLERGNRIWDWCETLAQWSEAPEPGQLSVTYLSSAHQSCAQYIAEQMRGCGFDTVAIDAVGNVVGRYFASTAQGGEAAKILLTGSHYDTVRNGGKYDGRLGVFIPIECVRALHAKEQRLPYTLEVVAFAEEEGQRYPATFLGSGALIGQFQPEWLTQTDAAGVAMQEAMRSAGLPGHMAAIAALQRDSSRYLGFIEVHIEQGPVLNTQNIPLGVVSSINGSRRLLGTVFGTACHAGTTPMQGRSDAAVVVAEIILAAQQRALSDPGCVATVGLLQVPQGSINVVPGQCDFSLDIRAPNNAQRDAAVDDIRRAAEAICQRHSARLELSDVLSASAAPSDARLQALWAEAVASLGLPVFTLPSGAGHDAMKLHEAMPQAMLFVRGENSGISHNPLESSTSSDMELAVAALDAFLLRL